MKRTAIIPVKPSSFLVVRDLYNRRVDVDLPLEDVRDILVRSKGATMTMLLEELAGEEAIVREGENEAGRVLNPYLTEGRER